MTLPTYRISEVKSNDPKDINQTVDQINRALDDIYSKQPAQPVQVKSRLIKHIALGDNKKSIYFDGLSGNAFDLDFYLLDNAANDSVYFSINNDKTAANYRYATYIQGTFANNIGTQGNILCSHVLVSAVAKTRWGKARFILNDNKQIYIIANYIDTQVPGGGADYGIAMHGVFSVVKIPNQKISSLEIYSGNLFNSESQITLYVGG